MVLYFFLGVLPSIIWLLFYLRKDEHPEPKRMVLKVFILGMAIAIPAIFLELGIFEGIKHLMLFPDLKFLIYIFLAVALTEEVLKYLIVKKFVLNNPEFDEPLDVMLYMIIAALGFAASENILILLNSGRLYPQMEQVLAITIFRFAGATFLHALSSAILGYFMALCFFQQKNRTFLLWLGLTSAVLLHGLFNFSIITIRDGFGFILPAVILITSALFVSYGFQKLKKLTSVCKLT